MGAAEKAVEPLIKPPKPFSLMAKMADGSYLPVVQAPELVALFRKRERSELDDLKLSLVINRQEGKCLYCLFDGGKSLLCIDGNDMSRVVAELQADGRPIEVAWELYTPKATEREALLVELMAIVIRRKLLATAVKKITPETKKEAVIRYLVAFQSLGGLPPSSLWVAEDLGCSHDWVTKVRNEAMNKHILPRATKYRSRYNVKRKADSTLDEALLKTNVIKFTSSATAIKTEAEMKAEAAEYERRREARREAAAETVKKTDDLVDKIIADPGSVIGPAPSLPVLGLPSPVDPDHAPRTPPKEVDDGTPEVVVEAYGYLDGLADDIPKWILSEDAIELLRSKASAIVQLLGDEADADEPAVDSKSRKRALDFVYQWNNDHGHLEDADLEWYFDAGILTIGANDFVSVIDKEQFVIMLSKLAPIVQRLGGDPSALDAVFESKPKRKPKSS
jgi:hypothetical protein